MQHIQQSVYVISSKVFLSKVIWSDLMELSGENLHIGELLDDPVPRHGSAEQVDQDDVFLRHVVLLQDLNCLAHFVARPHDGIEQENFPACNIVGELCEHDVCLVCLGVAVHQDLANPHGPAALLERLLHGLARPHNGHTAVAFLELVAGVSTAGRRHHLAVLVGQLVQTLLYHHSYQPVRHEFEI